MKKLSLIFICVILFTGLLNAQRKGTVTLGGDIGYNTSTDKMDASKTEDTYSYMYVGPQIGYFFSDNLQLGLRLNYYSSSSEDKGGTTTYKSDQNIFTFGPYVRIYNRILDKFEFFAEINASYRTGSRTSESTPGINNKTEYEISGYALNASPGFSYPVSNRFTVEAIFGQFGYSHSTSQLKDDDDTKVTTDEFSLFLDFSYVAVGFQMNL